MSDTLECQVRFLFEQQTETYRHTLKGVAQEKIVLGAKTLFGAINLVDCQKERVCCS